MDIYNKLLPELKDVVDKYIQYIYKKNMEKTIYNLTYATEMRFNYDTYIYYLEEENPEFEFIYDDDDEDNRPVAFRRKDRKPFLKSFGCDENFKFFDELAEHYNPEDLPRFFYFLK